MTLIPPTSQLDAEGWMLFTDMPRAERAARELTAALESAMACPTEEAAWNVIDPVRDKWAKVGACDSEPRNVIRAYFSTVFPNGHAEEFRIDPSGFTVPFV